MTPELQLPEWAFPSGPLPRQNAKRLETIAADVPHARSVLTEAAGLSRTGPATAYTLLRPNGRNAHLGPSFTKFLYFAGGGAEDHPCLILDRRVATALRTECGWTGLARTGRRGRQFDLARGPAVPARPVAQRGAVAGMGVRPRRPRLDVVARR
jgi:hypothetical protein